MPLPTDINALTGPRDVLDQALASKKGVRIKFPNYNMAARFRQKCYRLMQLEMKISDKNYPEGNPLKGRNPWAGLSLHMTDDQDKPANKGNVLWVEKMSAEWLRLGVEMTDLDSGEVLDVQD